MINVSSNVKKACNSGEPIRYREFIQFSDEIIVDIKGNLSCNAYTENTFFGTFNLKMLEFETENNIDYKGKEFDYYKEVNGEAFKIGRFIVTEVKDSDTFENVVVTSYDYGLKFAQKYESDLNFASHTVKFKDVINEICTKCGVELENEHLIGENVIIEENPSGSDVQFGNIIAYGAGFQGRFATINQNNKLEFILENSSSGEGIEIVTEDNEYLLAEDNARLLTDEQDIVTDYTELDDKRDTRPITCVLVAIDNDTIDYGAVVKDQALVDLYGENWLKIIGNPLIRSTQKCQEVAPLILNAVKGFGYSAFESKYTFKPYYTLGDKIFIKKVDGSLIKTNVLRITTEYDDITLQAPSIINASVEYDIITQEDKLNDAIINVDKANSQIVLKANSQGNLVEVELKGSPETGSEFNVKADNINLEGYTTINNGFSIDQQGNMTANNGAFTGGKVSLTDEGYQQEDVKLEIKKNSNEYTNIYSDRIIKVDNGNTLQLSTSSLQFIYNYTKLCGVSNGNLFMQSGTGNNIEINCNNDPYFKVWNQSTFSSMTPNGTWSPGYYNSSQESKKKNILPQENILDKIYESDIVSYNWKFEDDGDKKHIGLIIPDENGNYNTPEEVITHDGDSIELYSMCSASWKAIQELYDIIKLQSNKIKELEERLNGIIETN